MMEHPALAAVRGGIGMGRTAPSKIRAAIVRARRRLEADRLRARQAIEEAQALLKDCDAAEASINEITALYLKPATAGAPGSQPADAPEGDTSGVEVLVSSFSFNETALMGDRMARDLPPEIPRAISLRESSVKKLRSADRMVWLTPLDAADRSANTADPGVAEPLAEPDTSGIGSRVFSLLTTPGLIHTAMLVNARQLDDAVVTDRATMAVAQGRPPLGLYGRFIGNVIDADATKPESRGWVEDQAALEKSRP